jgi:hypothetical protein
MPVKVIDRSRLAKVLNAERLNFMAVHSTHPRQRFRMPVKHGHKASIASQGRE